METCVSVPSVCFEVCKVIGMSTSSTAKVYKVQWKPSWVSALHMQGCEQLIQDFLTQHNTNNTKNNTLLAPPDVPNTQVSENETTTERDGMQQVQQMQQDVEAATMGCSSTQLQGGVPLVKTEEIEVVYSATDDEVLGLNSIETGDISEGQNHGVSFQSDLYSLQSTTCSNDEGNNIRNSDSVAQHNDLNSQIDAHTIDNTSDSIVLKLEENSLDVDTNSNQFSFEDDVPTKDNAQTSDFLSNISVSGENSFSTSLNFESSNSTTNYNNSSSSDDGEDYDKHLQADTGKSPRRSKKKRAFQCCPKKSIKHAKKHEVACNSEEGLDEWKCAPCNKVFPNRDAMKCHMWYQHTAKKKHECDVCHRKFKVKSELVRHTRTHNGAKPFEFECDECGEKFSRKGNLVQHQQRTHTSPRTTTFLCPYCTKDFTRKDSLKRHMLRLHAHDG